MTRGASGWPGTGTSCWLAEILPVEVVLDFLLGLDGESESESESSEMDCLRLTAAGAFFEAALGAVETMMVEFERQRCDSIQALWCWRLVVVRSGATDRRC